ncbi:hypothetical protein B0I35DRAFT_63711 [Stachybotrys elegans]|uniref:Uncharacterized protein n=1 Tax=Stachybotrys elegans TaxID=80388 RepID=A0A8K0WPM2_9HYPO|nr:hypothetical protein B0I35DRAFT_63711 [Stachybotrys elegans]
MSDADERRSSTAEQAFAFPSTSAAETMPMVHDAERFHKKATENLAPAKTLRHRDASWRLFFREILWRILSAIVFNILIMVVLLNYERMGELDSWDRRLLNLLTILFTALMSLSLGSLSNFLGSMARWPLLARRSHSTPNADLILGMANLTGLGRLVWHHIKGRRLDSTTLIVLIYLLVSIGIRLSVASFGLAFELHEIPGVDFPIMAPDWNSPEWLAFDPAVIPKLSGHSDFEPTMDGIMDIMPHTGNYLSDYAKLGLLLNPVDFDPGIPEKFNGKNIGPAKLDRKIENATVKYSYHLKEYRGLEEHFSTHKVLQSASTCHARIIDRDIVYDSAGKIVRNLNS